MKKLFLILTVFVVAVACKAQLPSVVEMGQDSIRITRGEFVLRNGTKDVKGFLYNTGGGVTTFKRIEQLNDTTWIFGADTLHFNASIDPNPGGGGTVTASRGLHMNENDVRWGITPLDSAVGIDQVGNGITFHDGMFHHYWGDGIDYFSAYTELKADQYSIDIGGWDGGDNAYRLWGDVHSGNPIGGGWIMSADGPGGGHSQITLGNNTDYPGFLALWSNTGNIQFQGLIDSAQDYFLHYNPFTYKVTYSAGSGSGGSTMRFGVEDNMAGESRLFDMQDNTFDIQGNNGYFKYRIGDAINYSQVQMLKNSIDISANDTTGSRSNFAQFSSTANVLNLGASKNDGPNNWSATTQTNGDGASILHQIVSTVDGVHTGAHMLETPTGFNFYIPSAQDNTELYFQVQNLPYATGGEYRVVADGSGLFKLDTSTSTGTTTGSGSWLSSVTFQSGLHNFNTSTGRLGGGLLEPVTFVSNTFPMSITGSVADNSFNVTNTHATATAITGTGGTSGIGISGTGGSIGVKGTSTAGFGGSFSSVSSTGLFAQSQSGLAASFLRNTAATNVQNQIASFTHTTTATPTIGFGAHVSINLETTAGSEAGAGRLLAKWSNATTGSQASTIELWNSNAGLERPVLGITANGQAQWKLYTGTTFDATPYKALGVDSLGRQITYDPALFGGTGGTTPDPLVFDPTYFEGDGTVGDEITLKPTVVALQTDITDLNTRIDSMLAVWPAGAAAGKTAVNNISTTGDSLVVKVNDSLFNVKRLRAGTNVTFSVDGNSITINGASGSAEVNTLSITLSSTGTLTISTESILEYVLVNPTTTLSAFKIGTVADDDYYFPATSVPATSLAHEFVVQRYIPNTTAIQFSGITSSTVIDLIFKPIHR